MYDCCACCGDRKHDIGHPDPCLKHQRAEAAERAKIKKAARSKVKIDA